VQQHHHPPEWAAHGFLPKPPTRHANHTCTPRRLLCFTTLPVPGNPILTVAPPTAVLDSGISGGIVLNRHLAALGLDPAAFRDADNDAILGFLRDRNAQGAVPTARVRVMLVGHGGAGKTALARRIVRGTFEEGTPATDGVELHEVEVPIPDPGERKEEEEEGHARTKPQERPSGLTVQLVDTAGQPVYSGSDSLFFDATAIVVMVVDPTAVPPDKVEALLLSSAATVRAQAGNARVVVVATHALDHTREHAAAMDAAMASLLHAPANVDPAWLAVDSLDGHGVEALVARVRDTALDADAMPHVVSPAWCSP